MQPMATMALRAARKAGLIITRSMDRIDLLTIEEKGKNDLVSEIDRKCEEAIIKELVKAYPDHGFQGEESGISGNPNAEYVWIIDPLDGTTNFLHNIPHFSVSVAVRKGNRIEHGVVLDPVRNEEFVASRGHGAQLNDRRIRVSQRKSLDTAILGTGFPYRNVGQDLDNYMAMLGDLTKRCRGIRRAGSAALDLAYVAAGRFDAFWEYGLSPWDIAAGSLLVEEAGGLISDLAGHPNYMESGNIACGAPKVFRELLQVLRTHT